jgi:hypothetical protein
MGNAIVSPPNDLVPQAALTLYLRELPHCVVLRSGEDLFANLQRGGDVDLLVADLGLAERTLIQRLGQPVRITRRSYGTGYFYDWGNVDLLPSVEWRGARYLPVQAVIEGRRISETGWPVPSVAHEAVISWLTSLLWGGFFKERFAPVIRQATETDGMAFRETLIEVAGKKWGLRLWQAAADERLESSARWVRPLRRAIWWRACLKSPLRTVAGYLAFVIAEVRLRLAPTVPWIAIIGPDAGGNSTLVTEIARRFATCRYAAVREFAAPAGVKTEARVRQLGTVRYWTQLVHLRAKGFIPVFEGFDRIVGTQGYMSPRPDLLFLLDRRAEALRQRTPEVPLAELERQRHAYLSLVQRLPGGTVLDGNLPLSALVDEVQRVVRAWMMDRTLASETRVRGSRKPILVSDEGKVTGTP